jgi:hypothetical protein
MAEQADAGPRLVAASSSSWPALPGLDGSRTDEDLLVVADGAAAARRTCQFEMQCAGWPSSYGFHRNGR